MVTVNRVSECVVIRPSPSTGHSTTVCSMVHVDKHRRYREEVHLVPRLCAVRHADTVYAYTASSKRRYLSRTYYQRRLAPSRHAHTTFAFPPAQGHTYVTRLSPAPTTKTFKTSIEVRGRVKPDVNFNTEVVTPSLDLDPSLTFDSGPGASQVFIPQKKDRNACVLNIDTRSLDTRVY